MKISFIFFVLAGLVSATAYATNANSTTNKNSATASTKSPSGSVDESQNVADVQSPPASDKKNAEVDAASGTEDAEATPDATAPVRVDSGTPSTGTEQKPEPDASDLEAESSEAKTPPQKVSSDETPATEPTAEETRSASASSLAAGEWEGPLPPNKISLSAKRSYAAAVAEYHRQYKNNRIMQSMGRALLGSSFAFEIIGTVLIEVAPWGSLGWSGFATVGVGLVHFITSAFLLGFSKPSHHIPVPKNIYERRIAGIDTASPELLLTL